MNKRKKVMFFSIIWSLGLVSSLTKGQVTERVFPDAVGIDPICVLVAYSYLRSGVIHTAIFSFVQGLCLDIYSGGLKGLFVFLYLSEIGIIWLSCRFIDSSNPRGQILIVAMAWVTKEVLFFVLLFALDSRIVLETVVPWALVVAFLGTSLSAPVVFYFLDRVFASFNGAGHKDGLLLEM